MTDSLRGRAALFTALLLLLLPGSLSARTFVVGIVEGTITDAATGEPLPGATAQIQGTAIGAPAGLDGRFRIARVPEGDHMLVVSYVGYRTVEIPISVANGQTVAQNVQLELDVVEGEEIVITAQAEGQVAAINQQLSSNTIINVVSGARIEELPDVNAAESVGRLAGVSMVRSAGEGQKVVIRGLSPQYNTVTVNGRQLPATSDDRSTDLSMISSNLLAGIELFKAHTSDQDGDYLGGSVNFILAEAGEGLSTDVRLQGGYNNHESDYGQFKGSANVSNRFFGDRLGVIAQANAEAVNRGSDVFDASYNREGEIGGGSEELAPLFINSLTLIDRLEDRKRYGASLLFDYRIPNGKLRFTNFFSRLDRDQIIRDKTYSVNERILNYGLRDRDIQTDLLSNELGGEHAIGRSTVTWGLSRAISVRKTPYDNDYGFSERGGFITSQLVEDAGPALIPQAATNILQETAFSNANFRTNRLRERDLSAQLDVRVPYAFGRKIAGYLKTGGKVRSKDRVNDEARWLLPFTFGPGAQDMITAFPEIDFSLASQGFLSMSAIADLDYDPGEFLDGQYEFGFTPQLDFIREAYERIGDTYLRSSLADFDDFTNTEEIAAGYAMTQINFQRWLMIMPGVRYERTATEYTAARGRVANDRQTDAVRLDSTVTQDYDHLLPMLHVRIRPTSWFDIRLARTETLSRPDHFDISPRQTIAANARRVNRGIPTLRPAESTNYDVFLSFRGNRLGLFTFGVFWKDIEGLIFTRDAPVLDPAEQNLPADTRGFTVIEPFNNTGTTEVQGFEVDWQSNLTFLPSPFNGVVVNVNYARIDSETQYPRSLLRRGPGGFGFVRIDTFRVGDMLNQAKDIANFSVGYDRSGFSGRVSMLLQGESLSRIGVIPETDVFTGTFVRWDLSLKQTLTNNFGLFLNLNNFTGRPDKAFQVVEGFPTEQEFYGWTMDLGVRYRL